MDLDELNQIRADAEESGEVVMSVTELKEKAKSNLIDTEKA